MFSSFSLLPSLVVSYFGTETGNIVVAFLGVPLLSTLFASKAKLLVLEFSLSARPVGKINK